VLGTPAAEARGTFCDSAASASCGSRARERGHRSFADDVVRNSGTDEALGEIACDTFGIDTPENPRAGCLKAQPSVIAIHAYDSRELLYHAVGRLSRRHQDHDLTFTIRRRLRRGGCFAGRSRIAPLWSAATSQRPPTLYRVSWRSNRATLSERSSQHSSTSTSRVVRIPHGTRWSELGDQRTFTAFGNANGIGDLTLRLMGRFANGAAFGLDVRLLTGDEENLLGIGVPGIRPFIVLSRSGRAFSPHVNAGYRWNGSSVLAGNPNTGESADLPDQVNYVVGTDFGVSSRFTFVLDVIGNYFIDAPRPGGVPSQRRHINTLPTVNFAKEPYNQLSGAVGFKLNVVQSLFVDVNLLFNLDDNGLRDKITPLIGFEYTF
jgi:hypothetical protein